MPHNERMEFLGDAILGAVIAEWLYTTYPVAAEGELTRMRAYLVNKTSLVWLAQQLELGAYLELGGGELHTGGAQKPAILATAAEALLAAVYLDGGWQAITVVVRGLLKPRLQAMRLEKDAKTQLQEWLQAQRLPLPTYHLLATSNTNESLFTVTCQLTGINQRIAVRGQGTTRRGAEQQAAGLVLAQLRTSCPI